MIRILLPAALVLSGLPLAASAAACNGDPRGVAGDRACTLSIEPVAATTAVGPKVLRVAPKVPQWQVGEEFPVYKYNIVIDPPRHGLPAVTGNWRYYKADGMTYKVDARSYAVLEILR